MCENSCQYRYFRIFRNEFYSDSQIAFRKKNHLPQIWEEWSESDEILEIYLYSIQNLRNQGNRLQSGPGRHLEFSIVSELRVELTKILIYTEQTA